MGKVYLVGAGPGDPELLTVKAVRILAAADIVLHDALVSKEVLDLVVPTATVINVGKRCGKKFLTQSEINSILTSAAAVAKVVVRLKGGDPLIFGRAGEEIEALNDAGVEFEIVPGITAAIAAAAVSQVSLTDRRLASQVLFTTAHRKAGVMDLDWTERITPDTTTVVYMPGSDCRNLSHALAEKLGPEMPCVVVSSATLPTQQIRRTNVAEVRNPIDAPALLIVGRVARTKSFAIPAITRVADCVNINRNISLDRSY
jgi:uroporphyrin-III C-methyltransferase